MVGRLMDVAIKNLIEISSEEQQTLNTKIITWLREKMKQMIELTKQEPKIIIEILEGQSAVSIVEEGVLLKNLLLETNFWERNEDRIMKTQPDLGKAIKILNRK